MTDIQGIRTVSALLLDADGKLVLQLRDDKPGLPFPNCWSTLGGRVEEAETPDEAVQRELVEEIEFCPPLRFWKTFELSYTAHGRPMTSEVYVYVGHLAPALAEVHLHEGQRLGSFNAADIDDLPCAFGLDLLFKDFFAHYES